MPNVDIPQGIDTEGHTSGSGEGILEENIELMNIVPTPHDSPLTGGYTPKSDEGRIRLAELMETCIILSNRVTQLETELSTTKVVYNKAFITLTNKVKKLESQLKQKRSKAVIYSSDEEGPSMRIEDSPKQGRIIEEMDKDENINLVSEQREDLETLWKLVKDKYGNTRQEEGYERVLWGDLKVMFEPDIESEIQESTHLLADTQAKDEATKEAMKCLEESTQSVEDQIQET
uniref:Uncharacterized protein n=1 Tax=Tanacetum cinerariifolium TaxID=118510 RepID=A0A699KEE6_TANCI|nr:hypothetical protein [Tanacetum cinerariifolium]